MKRLCEEQGKEVPLLPYLQQQRGSRHRLHVFVRLSCSRVMPQGAERTGPRRKKLVQGTPLSQAAPERMDSRAGSAFLPPEVTSSGWEVTWQGSPGELVSQ